MDQKTLTRAAAQMEGDALFTGASSVTLWNLLVSLGVLPKHRALDALDAALLVIERRRETWTGDVAAIDQARARMTTLIGQIRAVPDSAA